jgi:hypothetical protein
VCGFNPKSAGILGLTGEKSPIKGKGTIRWKIEDNNSVVHTIKLKNALYILAFKTCLLCTQHWSQSMNDHFESQNGTWQASSSNHIILYWDQRQHKRTVPWDASTIAGYFWSTTGAIDYQVFSAAIDADNDIEQHEHVCFNSHTDGTPHLVSDDKQDEDSATPNANDSQVTNDFTYSERREENIADFFTKELPMQPTNIIEDEDKPFSAKNPQAKLLHWHYQLGHLPFACLWILALIGTIPKWSHSEGPKMCWLYVWSNVQATLENKRNSKQKQGLSSNLSW